MKVRKGKRKTISKNRLFTTAFWFFAVSFTFTLFAQPEPSIEENIFQSSKNLHQWGTISSFNGLPSERVNAISQTSDGFIWFATDNGLAKFDGRRVQTNLSAGLSSIRVISLETDADKTLWIGTEKGAFFYENSFFQPVRDTEDVAINSILIEGEDVYLTSPSGVVFKTSKVDNSQNTKKILETSLPLRSIVRIKNDLYVGTFNAGLLKIDDANAEQLITRPRPFFINALKRASNNNVWFGTTSSGGSSGLFVSELLPDLKVLGEDLGTVNSIAFGKDNETWVGTDNKGAFLFEGKEFRKRFTFENTSGGLRSNKILSIFVDREGVIWFGTDKGVNRYDSQSPRNEVLSEDIQSNFIRTLFRSKEGKVYAGTNRGLYLYKEKGVSWISVKGFDSRTIYSISETPDKTILIGSPNSLSANGNSTETLVKDESVHAIERFQGDTYFSSFSLGLKKLDSEDSLVSSQKSIISLHNESDKSLWFGTIDKGVFSFDGDSVIQLDVLDELKETAIRSITGNENIGIWFATDKGLYLFRDNKLDFVLPGQNSRDVLTTKDANGTFKVWCATENGLFSIAFKENFDWVSSRIDIEQGLASQNIFAIQPLDDSSLLLGTSRGIVRLNVNKIRPLLMPNRILSQRVHQPSELNEGINLDYPQNSLSVDVLAISSMTFPEQFQYSFLLFNSDNELMDKKFSEDSQFLMDKLAPDKYRVEVRAYDKNLLESEPLKFNLIVERAPFPLIAAILSVLLFIALAALLWAIFSQRKIFQTSEELFHANKELNNARLNLANEAERERHRISRDLHDQTLADLRHLILSADEVSTEKASEFRSEIEGISDEIRRICEDLSPSVLENIGFAASLEWALGNAVGQVPKDGKIDYEFFSSENLEEELELSRAEQIQIYRIVQEVLSNIVRHSDASKIKLNANIIDQKGFVLTIEDNGKTFDPDISKKGRGLSNIKARAKLIKSKVDWAEGESGGMTFCLTKSEQ